MRFLAAHAEALLAAVLFLISTYAAVYLVCTGALGMAGMAACCAIGFFQALQGFEVARDWRERRHRLQVHDQHQEAAFED